ncbi:MAG: 50S ribosomal protein L19e [archaeon]
MRLKIQKRLAASILKASPKRVKFDTTRIEDIKEAITKEDVRKLLADKAITAKPKRGISRGRLTTSKQGAGSRKGKKTARLPQKGVWMAKIRAQRQLLKTLRDSGKIGKTIYHDLYRKSKGGFFRSVRHIKLYIEEHKLIE